MFVAYFFEIFQYIHIFFKNVLQCHLVCVSTTEFKNIRPSRFVALLSFVFLLPIPLTSGGQEVERILCTWWIVTQIWSSEWKCTKEKDSDVVLDMRSNRDLSNARKEEKKPQNMWKDFLGGTNKLYQMPDHTRWAKHRPAMCRQVRFWSIVWSTPNTLVAGSWRALKGQQVHLIHQLNLMCLNRATKNRYRAKSWPTG